MGQCNYLPPVLAINLIRTSVFQEFPFAIPCVNAAFRESSLSTYAVGKAGVRFSVRKECRNDALNIIVIAEYDFDAEIPEDVELKVEAITPESNPEYYAQRGRQAALPERCVPVP